MCGLRVIHLFCSNRLELNLAFHLHKILQLFSHMLWSTNKILFHTESFWNFKLYMLPKQKVPAVITKVLKNVSYYCALYKFNSFKLVVSNMSLLHDHFTKNIISYNVGANSSSVFFRLQSHKQFILSAWNKLK